MTRNRDRLIDKKIGSVIRMQRVKLRISQSDLGNFPWGDLPTNTEIREWRQRGRINLSQLCEDASRRHAGARSVDIDLAGLERLDTVPDTGNLTE